jgi:serine/threonine protein kinase
MAFQRYICRFVPEDIEAALGRRYMIGPEIAVGGQGAVFRATRASRPDGTPANDDVALKLHFDRRKNARVHPEITATENFSHPNLARPVEHGYCDVAGRHTRYVAWEFIEGQSLRALLRNGPLLESEVLAIGRDILSAIAEIWSQRIVHADINPSNIMLRNSDSHIVVGSVDSAVLIDLGAARYLDQHDTRTLRPSRTLDQHDRRAAYRPWGTWGYFSPEQIRGEQALTCAWRSNAAMLTGATSHRV